MRLSPLVSIHRFDSLERKLTAASSREKLFASKSFKSTLSEKLDTLLDGEGMVLSLDVFDTLLMRDNSSELTRFYEIGERMAEIANDDVSRLRRGSRKTHSTHSVSGVDAFLARMFGTNASYRASTPVKGCREGSLNEIHITASRLLTGADKLADAFVDAELDYETGFTIPPDDQPHGSPPCYCFR